MDERLSADWAIFSFLPISNKGVNSTFDSFCAAVKKDYVQTAFPIGASSTGNVGVDSCFQVFKSSFYPQIGM